MAFLTTLILRSNLLLIPYFLKPVLLNCEVATIAKTYNNKVSKIHPWGHKMSDAYFFEIQTKDGHWVSLTRTRDSKLSPLVEMGLKISAEIQTRDSKLSPFEMGFKISGEIQTRDSTLSPLVENGS
jgi:hypothetical protein